MLPLPGPLPRGEGIEMLPLPLGEGWGEGKRNIKKGCNSPLMLPIIDAKT